MSNYDKLQQQLREKQVKSTGGSTNAFETFQRANKANTSSSLNLGELGLGNNGTSFANRSGFKQAMQPVKESAYQRLTRRETEPAQAFSWYSGDTPTGNETLARIYTVAQQDPQRGEELYKTFGQYQSDPSSPFYAPYQQPTSVAVQNLAAMGYDVSGGVNADWFGDNAYLTQHYRMGANGKPLAPSSKSTPEQDAAYWYYQGLADEDLTQKAEAEWEALTDVMTYWAGRTDLNLSYDQILEKIDWSLYPTLVASDEAAAKRTPLQFTRPIGYSKDAMQGVVWAAWNNGGTGNYVTDGVNYARSYGNMWEDDPEISARFDPSSDAYHPYLASTTLDDAAQYFGVSSFGPNWLEENKHILSGNDETAKMYYRQVQEAEAITLKAEEEYASLTASIDERVAMANGDPGIVMQGLQGQHPTLAQLDEGRKSGNVVGLTRSVAYRDVDVAKLVEDRCATYNNAPVLSAFATTMSEKLGKAATVAQSQQSIDASRNQTISEAASTILEIGSVAEQRAFRTFSGSRTGDYIQILKDAVNNAGVYIPENSVGLYNYANNYAADEYMSAVEVIAPYQQAVADRDAAQAELDALWTHRDPELGPLTPEETERANECRSVIYNSNQHIEANQAAYDAAMETTQQIAREYESTTRLANILGLDVPEGYIPTTDLVDYAYRYGSQSMQPQWSLTSIYSAALDNGSDVATVYDQARADRDEARAEIAYTEMVLEELDSRGVIMDPQYERNLRDRRDSLARTQAEAEYFLLRENPDFARVASTTAEEILAYSAEHDGLMVFNNGEYSDLTLSIVGAKPSLNMTQHQKRLVSLMTDDERDTYLYIAGTEGEEAAQKYFDTLSNDNYGVLTVRNTEWIIDAAEMFATLLPGPANTASIVTNMYAPIGTVWAGFAYVTGQDISPYHPAFLPTHVTSAIRGTTKQDIDKTFENNETLKGLVNFAYDAGMGALDSFFSGVAFGKFSPTLQGLGGSSSTIVDVTQRGGDEGQAIALGAITFAAEWLSEKIGLDNMEEAIAGGVPAVKKLVLSSIGEGASEAVGAVVTNVADTYIMGELSEYSTNVDKYMEDGKTERQARELATRDMWYNIFYEGAVGTASGAAQMTFSGQIGRSNKRQGQVDDAATSEKTAQTVAEAETGGRDTLVTDVKNTPDTAQELESVSNSDKPTGEDTLESETLEEKPMDASEENEAGEGKPEARYPDAPAQNAGLPRPTFRVPPRTDVRAVARESGDAALYPDAPVQNTGAVTRPTYRSLRRRNEARAVAYETKQNDRSEARYPDANEAQTADLNRRKLYAKMQILDAALTAPRTENKAAAVAAVFSWWNSDNTMADSVAQAATAHLFERFGADRAVRLVRDIVLAGTETNGNIDAQTLTHALITASFGRGSASNYLSLVVRTTPMTGVYEGHAIALCDMARNDWSNADLMASIRQEGFDLRIAEREMELIGEGALNGVRPYEDAHRQAQENLREAEEGLKRAAAEAQAAGQNLVTVQSQWVSEPSNTMLQGAVLQATKDVEGKAIVQQQYEQSVAKNTSQVQQTRAALTSQREQAMKPVREQAQRDVAAEIEAEEQARVEAEAAQAIAPQESTDTIQRAKKTSLPELEVKNPPGGTPKKSAEQVTKDLLSKLGVGDVIGTKTMSRMSSETQGYYDRRAKYVAVRSLHAGDYRVDMHEAGHAVADKLGMTGTADMVAKLPDDFKAQYKTSELPGEAFAEFFRRYMVAEEHARDFAGGAFVDTFEHNLRKNKLWEPVHTAAIELRRWMSAGIVDQLGAIIHPASEKNKTPFIQRVREVMNGLVDSTSVAGAVNDAIREQQGEVPLMENVREYALLHNHAAKRAFNLLTKNLTDSHGTIIGDALNKAFEKIDAKDMPLFEKYLLVLHSVDRDAQGKPVYDIPGFTPEQREKWLQWMKTDHQNFVEAAEALQTFRKKFLQAWLVDTGYFKQDDFDRLNTLYPNYVPTQRVKSNNAGGWHRKTQSSQFQIRKATGSTEDIWSPLDTFYEMVDSVVEMVSLNDVGLAWHRAFENNDGLGWFGERINPDLKQVSVDTKQLQEAIREKLDGNVTDDVLSDVLEMIGPRQTQWLSAQKSSLKNAIAVQLPDGSTAFYEIRDPELFKMLSGKRGDSPLKAFRRVTRQMAVLTTGNNPLYGLRNFARDFQRSVNFGTWAISYPDGIIKWVKAFIEVAKNSDLYQQYEALGGGGWARIEAGTKKGITDIQSALFPGYYKTNIGRRAQWVGKKIWNTVTLARFNELIEQTSRFVEFKYGKHDLTTAEGRMEAFNASQNVTADFARRGNSALAAILGDVIPFFNASMQGVYQTARMFSKAERDQLPARITRAVFNTALMSAISSVLLLKFLDDDEKEDMAMLSDEMWSKHFYIPNFAPWFFGNDPVIRIPLVQDPLAYVIHGMVTNAIWHGDQDEFVIGMVAIANTVIDDLNPFSGGTILRPFMDAGKNETHFGGSIVPPHLEGLDPTAQYTEETPDFFVTIGRAIGVSPMIVQYIAEQYTGFLGQMVIPFISKDTNTGTIGGWDAVRSYAQKRFTSDPLVSTDVIGSFYDGQAEVKNVVEAINAGKPANMLRRGLTPEQGKMAYLEAKEMTSEGGVLYDTAQIIKEGYANIEEINEDSELTDEQKEELITMERRKMCQAALVAQEAIGEYRAKYMTGLDIVARFTEGPVIQKPTAYDMLDETFLNDADQRYMQRAKSVFEATGNASALPHPNTYFDEGGVRYEIEGTDDWDNWNAAYKNGYIGYLSNVIGWDTMTPDEQLAHMKTAHSEGHKAAKAAYKKAHPEIEWKK